MRRRRRCRPLGAAREREADGAPGDDDHGHGRQAERILSFTLSKKSAPAGAITFKVTNGGAIPHDFKLCSSPKGTTKPNTCAGKSTPMLSPGAMGFKSLIVTLKAKGTYEYMCTVPGHAAGGMKGVFKVT